MTFNFEELKNEYSYLSKEATKIILSNEKAMEKFRETGKIDIKLTVNGVEMPSTKYQEFVEALEQNRIEEVEKMAKKLLKDKLDNMFEKLNNIEREIDYISF